MRANLLEEGMLRRLRLVALVAVAVVAALAFAAGARPAAGDPLEFVPDIDADTPAVDRNIPGNQSSAHVPSTGVPRPAPLAVVAPGSELGTNFSGLNFRDQRVVADGGRQLSLEPPDQAVCVGGGTVLEAVNDVFSIYTPGGTKVEGPQAMNPFFTGDHQIIRSPTVVFGTFISDPKCYYDQETGRFFMTVLTIGRNATTGAFLPHTDVRVAVSKTSSPTTNPADWNFTVVDTTNDGTNGTPSHPGCPCLGDQPLIGADHYGFYITTNEFSLFGSGFNGAQIYALGKAALAAGLTPKIQRIEGAPIASSYGDGTPYSLQPATSPSAADFVTANNGTEYLLGALEFGKFPFTLDDRIAVWALTNTRSLEKGGGSIAVDDAVISSQVYGLPPNIVQKDGPTPLADSVKEHETLIDGGDDRMQVAVWAHGLLWGANDTVVKTPTGSSQVGVAYYVVSPSVSKSTVSGSVVKQGYISVEKASVTRPSLAITSQGKGVIGVSLIGPDFYPSAAYTTVDDTLATGAGALRLVANGVKPADGFSGYFAFGASGVERWGDYGAAAVDGNSIWVANEWIQGNIGFPLLANWNTYVSRVTP